MFLPVCLQILILRLLLCLFLFVCILLVVLLFCSCLRLLLLSVTLLFHFYLSRYSHYLFDTSVTCIILPLFLLFSLFSLPLRPPLLVLLLHPPRNLLHLRLQQLLASLVLRGVPRFFVTCIIIATFATYLTPLHPFPLLVYHLFCFHYSQICHYFHVLEFRYQTRHGVTAHLHHD